MIYKIYSHRQIKIGEKSLNLGNTGIEDFFEGFELKLEFEKTRIDWFTENIKRRNVKPDSIAWYKGNNKSSLDCLKRNIKYH